MNPNTTIKPWLLACGKQLGIRQAHDYRWPDADTRQAEKYCTYRLMTSVPTQEGHESLNTATDHTAHRRSVQQWLTTIQIDMYNVEDGLYDLASFAVAADGNPAIRAIFGKKCAFRQALQVVNLTEADNDSDIRYHHQLTCTFIENPEITIDDANAVVDGILTNIDVINHPA